VYYWRARTFAGDKFWNGSQVAYPHLGPASEVRKLTVTGETLGSVKVMSPPWYAVVKNPVQLTVDNVAKTPGVGPISYRFSLGSDLQPPIAEASIPEGGGGKTSWTVPFDLPVGASYRWFVRAVDSATGSIGPYASATFGIAAAAAIPYKITITLPPSCTNKPAWTFATIFSRQSLAGPSFDFSTPIGTLAGSLVIAGGHVSGTMIGRVNQGYAAGDFSVRLSQTAAEPVTISGIVDATGTMRGTFSGYLSGSNNYGNGGSCTATDIPFSISPQL
jgi:hypothetical protein